MLPLLPHRRSSGLDGEGDGGALVSRRVLPYGCTRTQIRPPQMLQLTQCRLRAVRLLQMWFEPPGFEPDEPTQAPALRSDGSSTFASHFGHEPPSGDKAAASRKRSLVQATSVSGSKRPASSTPPVTAMRVGAAPPSTGELPLLQRGAAPPSTGELPLVQRGAAQLSTGGLPLLNAVHQLQQIRN